jgi:hypothetical protein
MGMAGGSAAAAGCSTTKESLTLKNTSTTDIFADGLNRDMVARSFTAGSSYNLCAVEVYGIWSGTGSAASYHVEIRTNNAGVPSETQVGGDSNSET